MLLVDRQVVTSATKVLARTFAGIDLSLDRFPIASPILTALTARAVIAFTITERDGRAVREVDMAGVDAHERRSLAAAIRADRIKLFGDEVPIPEQRDRVVVLGSAEELAAATDRRLSMLGELDDGVRERLRMTRDCLARHGLAQLVQHRMLICDHERLVAYVNVFTERRLSRRKLQALEDAGAKIRDQIAVRTATASKAVGIASLVEAVLAANPQPVFLLSRTGRVLQANPHGDTLLATEPAMVEELRALGTTRTPRFDVIQLAATDTRRLVVARAAARDVVAEVLSRSGLGAKTCAVVAQVARGYTNKEVAAELGVADNTVEYHLTRAYARLGVRTRLELLALVSGVEGTLIPMCSGG